jgi:hypothetical protein
LGQTSPRRDIPAGGVDLQRESDSSEKSWCSSA